VVPEWCNRFGKRNVSAAAPVIRVLVAEDMHIVRGALVALLRLEPGIDVVAEVASGLPDPHPHSLGRPGTLRRALDAKVGGFLLKDAPPDKLANAVRGVLAARRMVDGDLALGRLGWA
jgi:two-component system response regulator DesR